MPERIYTLAKDRKLKALVETRLSTENELQALIAEQPELLDGEQIRPGDARRWILVTREKAIAASTGGGARWSVDHLIIDQDAVPTLAEVKRGSNPEIRRTIVGQFLEYAACASESWTADELRAMFEHQCEAQGRDAEAELATLLQKDGDADVDEFWDAVSTNLAAKRMRLLFVADFIPDPLARMVEFLNAQMPGVEVLAVEVKRFDSADVQTLVPRVIGRTAAKTRGPGESRPRLTQESFLERFEDEAARDVAERLLVAAAQAGADICYGTTYAVTIRARCSIWPHAIAVAWLHSEPKRRGLRRTRDFSFGAPAKNYALAEEFPEQLRSRLEGWMEEIAADSFAEDVSGKDVKAWAITHENSVPQAQVLAERLRRIVSELTSL